MMYVNPLTRALEDRPNSPFSKDSFTSRDPRTGNIVRRYTKQGITDIHRVLAQPKEVKKHYINDCKSCFGYGIWPNEAFPVYHSEAESGFEAEECPECGEDNYYYSEIKSKRDSMTENSIDKKDDFEKFTEVLYNFDLELRCAELSPTQD